NLGDISYIIQETESQGNRILDYCTMGMNVEESGEAEIIVRMQDKIDSIRENIGDDERYKDNRDMLVIVENLIHSYATSYKSGVSKCGDHYSMAADMDFYSMVDTASYIVKNCNKLLSLEMNRSEDLKERISSNFTAMIITVSIIVVIDILLTVLMVYLMTSSITHPLGLLMSHIYDISKEGLLDNDLGSNRTEAIDV
ncbi:MAG: hypothetical protein K6F00_09710, partial [Lachnospiraceae bacterium]|nr:hypothetical protein [Lachnospiraceae bacterium]